MSECERLDREVEEVKRRGHERIQTLEQQVGATLWSELVFDFLVTCLGKLKVLFCFSSIRSSSTQRTLSPSVPTESERRAR